MHRNTKVATCCYCGTRAALVLGEGRHELVCASCGAPLSNLKSLPQEAPARPAPSEVRKPGPYRFEKEVKKSKSKSRKGGFKRLFDDIIDEIGDIID